MDFARTIKRLGNAMLAMLASSFILTIMVFGNEPFLAKFAIFWLMMILGWPFLGFIGWALIIVICGHCRVEREDLTALHCALVLGPLALYQSTKAILTGNP